MVVIMASVKDSPLDRSNNSRSKSDCYTSHESVSDCKVKNVYFEDSESFKIIRSVGMSENVAYAVVNEVKHFIHVNTFETENSQENEASNAANISRIAFHLVKDDSTHVSVNRQLQDHDYFHSLLASCSFVLPSESDAVVAAVVISKWDDVIGPQTVHAWLKCDLKFEETLLKNETSFKNSFSNNVIQMPDSAYSNGFSEVHSGSNVKGSEPSGDMCVYKKLLKVLKAVKYISSHTVNFSSGSVSASDKTTDRNVTAFIVPEIDLIAQCLAFQFKDEQKRIPYSIALVMNYHQFNCCLQLSHYCRHWLQEISYRIEEIFVQSSEATTNLKLKEEVNSRVFELCSRMTSLGTLKITALNPSFYSGVVYNHFLPCALTSHLQTSCCSVVSGASVHYTNMLIAFLALFLENTERACSCFAKSTVELTFHHGLFLQGMITNKYGLQDCNYLQAGKHLDPITSISFVRNVAFNPINQRQFHWLYATHIENNLHELVIVRNNFEPVKRSASLVSSFLSDMNRLPSTHWQSLIYMFKKKLTIFAYMLLTLISTLSRETDCRSKVMFQGDLCGRMGINSSDFLIILAVAEKLKPGTYNYIIECTQSNT